MEMHNHATGGDLNSRGSGIRHRQIRSPTKSSLPTALREMPVAAWLLFLQQLASDDQPLDLAGAFPDRTQLHVAIELLGRIILDETIATMDLYALVGAPDSHFAGKQF